MNIKIVSHIATSVASLDVTINNENGRLRTSVYHKSAAEPYILPFTSGHPRHIHRNIPYVALLRAARLRSNVEDFNAECVRLDVSLLLNDYSSGFISKLTDRFFRVYNAMSVLNEHDEHVYRRLHRIVLSQYIRREKRLAEITKDTVTSPAVLQKKQWNANVMYPYYVFDRTITVHLEDRFHKRWNHFYRYSASPVRFVDVNLTAATNRTLENALIHKKPSKHILTNMNTTE